MRRIFVGKGTKLFAVGKKISYSYDNNGNTVQDGLKGLHITYNILNLPQTVTQGGAVKATYGWFADGSKYSVQDAQGNGYCYIGSLIYSTTAGAAVLESTDFSGGRIVLSGNTQTIHYHHKDHLGSVRAITDGSGSTIEQNAYYPFGGRHTFGQTYAQTTANRYKFNGKELQTTGNLSLLDYGARMYDTKIGRWLVQDPLAEKYYPFSAYNYCVNNPVMFVDKDGREASPIYDKDGNLLGTDDNGLQGEAIIMDKDYFKQGMSHSEALKKNLGIDGLSSDEAKYKFETSFNSLNNRPDWDGYLTLKEANEWYRKGNGAPLYVDFRKLDLSKIDINNITLGKTSYVNLQKHGKIFDEGLVYGTIGITKTTDNGIKSTYDNYDFDMKTWTGNSKRNIATIIGKLNAGNGVKYKINFYGIKY